MIKDNKKLSPFLGILIGIVLIFFGIFGVISLWGTKLNEGLFVLVMLPFVSVGMVFFTLNSSFLGLRMLAGRIDESAKILNPMTFFSNNYIITKITTGRDLYIIKFNDKFLHVVQMNNPITSVSVPWIRRVFLGPQLPTSIRRKSLVIAEFNGFKIRKRQGKAVLYDIVDKQWISGQATMFSIAFVSKSLTQLFPPDTFQQFIETIDQYSN